MHPAIERAHQAHVRELLRPKGKRPAPVKWVPRKYEPEPPFPSLTRAQRERIEALTGRSPEESYVLLLTQGSRRTRPVNKEE